MREEDMETKNPTVAVVMCTYNGEKYLREQMDSILAQTYPIHEIIVQDDRSTDGTVALLRLCRLCLRHRAALLPPHQHAPAAGAAPSGASSTPSSSHGTARSLTWSRGKISI